jgi:nucleotide-binding universal stress UspA family protein
MPTIAELLVPMDGSPLSKAALEVALDEYPEASVTVLHVINPAEPGYSYPIDVDPETEPLHGSEAWYDRAESLADRLFDEVEELAEGYGATVATEVVVGDPGRVIVTHAAEEPTDQIVIGSHGREDADQHLLGSVTETVVFRAPVRVLLVR